MTDEKALAQQRFEADLTSAPFTFRTIQAIATTDFVPRELRSNVPAILACILAGREWGLGPMESLSRIDMIDGRPAPSGELRVARVVAAGHEIYPKDVSDKAATAVGIRHFPDGSTHMQEYTFTWEMAEHVMVTSWEGERPNRRKVKRALTTKDNWQNYPGPMLYWRAASQLIRFLFPDVLSSFRAYTPDELGSSDWTPPEAVTSEAADESEMVATIVEAEGSDAAVEVEAWEAMTAEEETAEILADEETMAAIAEAETDLATGATVTLEELGGQIQEKPPEDYEERLVGFVTGWLGGDEQAARLEVTRVVKGRRLDQKLANDLYARLRKRLSKEDGQKPLL